MIYYREALLLTGVLSFAAGVLVDGVAHDMRAAESTSPVPVVYALPPSTRELICAHFTALHEPWKCRRVDL